MQDRRINKFHYRYQHVMYYHMTKMVVLVHAEIFDIVEQIT